ncbi:MAG: hypothetical protein MJ230_07560 [bacterium]|nr:hypothetical protein [bacterium]
MKKLLSSLLLMIITGLTANSAVMTYEEASSQNSEKPMAVLVYADWADGYTNALNEFKKTQKTMTNSYNYVELNVASKDMKNFNKKYVICTNLPYILLLRSNGKFSSLIDYNCALNTSCTVSKMKSFQRK